MKSTSYQQAIAHRAKNGEEQLLVDHLADVGSIAEVFVARHIDCYSATHRLLYKTVS